ncbi:MAG: hypothetical protein DRG39_04575, partial [Deltaproteobacteria bacterium]
LAGSYNNKAFALDSLGRPKEAADILDKAIGIYERLVYKEGRWELVERLAKTKFNKAQILFALGEKNQATEAMEVIELLEEGIRRGGGESLRKSLLQVRGLIKEIFYE